MITGCIVDSVIILFAHYNIKEMSGHYKAHCSLKRLFKLYNISKKEVAL